MKALLVTEQDEAKRAMYARTIASVDAALLTGDRDTLLASSRGTLGDYLDVNNPGAHYDNSAFEALPRRFEQEYHDDMTSLNVSIRVCVCVCVCVKGCVGVCYLLIIAVKLFLKIDCI